jgi:hypothetical protein
MDMIRSMVVVVAFVGVVLLFAPQPGPVDQPQVDSSEAVTAVSGAADVLGAAPLLLLAGDAAADPPSPQDVPAASALVDLGAGWRLDYARTETTDEVPTWRQGVLSPEERRVDLEQAVDPTEEWLTRADAGRVGDPEPVDVGGLAWSRQQRGDGDVAYTHVGSAGQDGAPALTTAVSGTSDSEDLREVVERVSDALQP